MDFFKILQEIAEPCIVIIVGVLARYIIQFVQAKFQEIKAKTKNETELKYATMIEDTILKCVKTTNQTYVETLKKQGKFDEKAQEEAFKRTFDAVILMLGKDAMNYIKEITSDTNTYLKQLIESTVGDVKK